MAADAFYTLGKDHKICQDFASAADNGVSSYYAVIADGCSTAKSTDWGSRLVGQLIGQIPQVSAEVAFQASIFTANGLRKTLRLPEECLRTTLLWVQLQGPAFITSVLGDGVVVARQRKEQSWEILDHEFSSGAPYYCQYELSATYREQYLKEFPGTFTTTGYRLISGQWELEEQKTIPVEQACKLHRYGFAVDAYDVVGVLSDGVKLFQSLDQNKVDYHRFSLETVMKELLNLKSIEGAFVQRRCQRALKLWSQDGIHNHDDFSFAAISAP